MPIFLLIHRHSPENCSMFNKEARKVHLDLKEKLEAILKKHEIKELGCWCALSEHTMYDVYDAPSLEAFERMAQEPEIVKWFAYNTVEIKLVYPSEEVVKMLKHQQ
jgi:L-rhamnose mutarotase